MEDENAILIEDDILKFIRFNGGIYGTNAVIVGADYFFVNKAFKKTSLKINTGARENHEVCWLEDSVQIKKS